MLVLSRRLQETLVFTVPPSDQPQVIEVSVQNLGRSAAKLGIQATRSVRIDRGENVDRAAPPAAEPQTMTDLARAA